MPAQTDEEKAAAAQARADKKAAADALEASRVTVDLLPLSASERIPMAGLLASDPELTYARHTHEEWQELLDEYLASPRP